MTTNIEEVEAEFERMRDKNMSNYVHLGIGCVHLDGGFTLEELEAIVAQMKMLT